MFNLYPLCNFCYKARLKSLWRTTDLHKMNEILDKTLETPSAHEVSKKKSSFWFVFNSFFSKAFWKTKFYQLITNQRIGERVYVDYLQMLASLFDLHFLCRKPTFSFSWHKATGTFRSTLKTALFVDKKALEHKGRQRLGLGLCRHKI